MFTPPTPEELKGFSAAGINDLANMAKLAKETLVASVTPETVSDEQLAEMESYNSFLTAAAAELSGRQERGQRFTAAAETPEIPAEPETAVTAAAETFDAEGNKDVTTSTQGATQDVVVEATVTAASTVQNAPRRAASIAEMAPHVEPAEVTVTEQGYTILAAADIAKVPTGTELTWSALAGAFEERSRSYPGILASGGKNVRMQHPLAFVRRDFGAANIAEAQDSHEATYAKLKSASDAYNRGGDSLVAANGWCAPSTPDYSICNPISTDGLWSGPEMVLRRGGLLHNQGLDFSDFFGGDFTLPIPGYNILTEAQVIADTAKTCVEIPCPAFVDDRLNVAALCLTSSLLQNRGYPEFVSEFVQGAIAAMAHLVNREVINEIEAGSTAIVLSGVDPWASDGSVWSQVFAVIDMVAVNIRTAYRARRDATVEFVFPQWLYHLLRSDWLRRNATHTEELTDAMISAAATRRNVRIQWVYDWQDAFDPTNGAGAIDVNHQFGNPAGPIAAALMNAPTAVTFLAYLPGTWVLGRNDVIRLDSVYDSTNLQQNLVTQLFMEDGFKPMRMCQFSFAYTVNICANGSTGVQRAVTCTDVTP